MTPTYYRTYVVVRATAAFFEVYTKGTTDDLKKLFLEWFPFLPPEFTLERPSLNWPLETRPPEGDPVRVKKLIVVLVFTRPDAVPELERAAKGGDPRRSSALAPIPGPRMPTIGVRSPPTRRPSARERNSTTSD